MNLALLGALFLAIPAGQDSDADFAAEADQAVRSRDYRRLEELSRRRTTDHPDQSLAWFYLGYARAAQGDYAGAVPHYQEAIRRGLKQFKSLYQLGYCAHRASLHHVAVEALAEALSYKPADADSLYHLGVSQYELKNFEDAERTLSKLLSSNSRWTELGRFHRMLARFRLRSAGAREDYDWIRKEAKTESLRKKAQEIWERESQPDSGSRPLEAIPPTGPWNFSYFQKFGYDSNVLRLPGTSETRPTAESDLFLATFVSASFDVLDSKALAVRASALDVSYSDLKDLALDAVLLAAESEVPTVDRSALLLSATFDYFLQDRDSLFWRAGGRLGYRADVGGVQSRLWLAAGLKEFQETALDELDATDVGVLTEFLIPVADRLPLRFRYEAHLENAESSDRSYREHRLELRAEMPVLSFLKARLDGGVRYRGFEEEDRFYGDRRKEVRTLGRGTLLVDVSSTVQPFAEYEVERNESSISDFDYRRSSVSLGLLIVF